MTWVHVLPRSSAFSLFSDRVDPLWRSAIAWSGTAHCNNLGVREKNRPWLCGRILLWVLCSFIA